MGVCGSFVLVEGANYASGVADHDGVCGYVLGDDGTRTDDGVLADGHAAQDDGTATDPDVVLNLSLIHI